LYVFSPEKKQGCCFVKVSYDRVKQNLIIVIILFFHWHKI